MNDINVILAAHPGLGRVRLCECNSIHLSIGPVTVNLAPEAFAQWQLWSAMEQLTEIVSPEEPPSSPLESLAPHHSLLTH
jgi:hypothetical protein